METVDDYSGSSPDSGLEVERVRNVLLVHPRIKTALKSQGGQQF